MRVLRRSCVCVSRTRRIATNKTPGSTCISEPWKALACRKPRRRSKSATNFGSLKEDLTMQVQSSFDESAAFDEFVDLEGAPARSHASCFDQRRRPETL